jgi:hypothetical protein
MQGWDIEVLRGAERMLNESRVSALMVELNMVPSIISQVPAVVDYLAAHDYECYLTGLWYLIKLTSCHGHIKLPAAQNQNYGNLLCAHAGLAPHAVFLLDRFTLANEKRAPSTAELESKMQLFSESPHLLDDILGDAQFVR